MPKFNNSKNTYQTFLNINIQLLSFKETQNRSAQRTVPGQNYSKPFKSPLDILTYQTPQIAQFNNVSQDWKIATSNNSNRYHMENCPTGRFLGPLQIETLSKNTQYLNLHYNKSVRIWSIAHVHKEKYKKHYEKYRNIRCPTGRFCRPP